MSTEVENLIHIEDVDVDDSAKENGSRCEINSDSGIETIISCSSEFPLPSDTINSLLIEAENHVKLEKSDSIENTTKNESLSSLSSPTSITPDDVNESCSSDDGSIKNDETNNISLTKDENLELDYKNVLIETSTNAANTTEPNDEAIVNTEAEIVYKLDNFDVNNLATSSVSLNEHKIVDRTICKSPYSRSAENISTIDQTDTKLNVSDKDLNTEKILSEFTNQKTRVAATQKIPEQNTDAKYVRYPKEILSQDIGNIVKNVHGIFSSVSGSLKNAYNNSHRVSLQKVPKNIVKPIPNGKVMNDIFEDELVVEKDKIDTTINIDSHVTEKPVENTPEKSGSAEELKTEHTEVENDAKKDVYKLQIESLERVLAEQRKENSVLRERVKQHVDELQSKDLTFKELEVKLDMMSKRVEQAEREKDAAVMRYASVECAAIEARRAADKAAQAEKAAVTEAELLNNKIKSAHSEKQRICQLYDDKCHELMNTERELGKVREDMKELEGRLKWTQSKLRVEMDAYKESSERADKLAQQVSELEAAKDAAAANATDSVRAKQLELELKESQAALILCRHEKEDLERRLSLITIQLDTCKKERDSATNSLTQATAEVEKLKESNLRLEEEAAELAALRAQAALADTLTAQLHRESERASQAEEALSIERARAETCARREAAALEHSARVTAQQVLQQASSAHHEAKAQALASDNASLREKVTSLEAECTRLQTALDEETDRRNKENKMLARKVAELTEEVAEVTKKLEWEKGENNVLKKKHASAIKELNRELQRALKRCEQLEAKLPQPDSHSTRTGSVSSLSSGESAAPDERLQNGHTDTVPDIQVREPDRQALIERIVSLQRAAARRAERCEFLEEHSKQLTGELRSKSRLLRHLLSTLPAGAVVPEDRDMNKKEIARLGGGAMAAVWGGDPTGISPQLSLEMNNRLQALLEDTLLKNMTLKENIDTLGAEISRLKEQMHNAGPK